MLGRLGQAPGMLSHRVLVPREGQEMHPVLGRAEASLSHGDVLQLTSPAPPLLEGMKFLGLFGRNKGKKG